MSEQGASGPRLSSPSWRFSIRTMLIAMAVIAACIPLGGYTLRHASTWIGSFVFLVTTMLLAGMVCLAFNRQGESRAYWTGAAIFGIAYFLVGGDPWSQPYNYELITETISNAAYDKFYPEGESTTQPDATDPPPVPSPIPPGAEQVNDSALADSSADSGANPVPEPPSLRDFVMVAHMYWSLLFALVGGWVSLLMYWTGRRQAQEP